MTQLYEIENLSGSSYDDTLQGDENANSLYGEGGDDVLKGGGGADKLFGGAGDDTLNSDGIGDFLDGGTGIDDTVDFADAQNGVYVNLGMGRYNQGHLLQAAWRRARRTTSSASRTFTARTPTTTSSATMPITTSPAKAASTPSSAATATTPSMAARKTTGSTATAGDDLLTGGAGNDNFMFDVPTVTDRSTSATTPSPTSRMVTRSRSAEDIFSDFDDLQDHMQQVGNDVVITYDDGNSITLQNTNIGSLNANDFLFY